MSEINERYLRAKIKCNLAIFDKIEKLKKDYFEKNPDADNVEITLKNPKTGEEMVITLHRDDSQT